MDEDDEERSHGVTMEVGQKRFCTRAKDVTILDAPGHRDFVPKMISGACQADAALLVVPAVTGEFEAGFDENGQIKEHTILAKGFGVNQVIVAVNKLDSSEPPWSQDRFNDIRATLEPFLAKYFKKLKYIPVSGLSGENVFDKNEASALRQWYQGETLVEVFQE